MIAKQARIGLLGVVLCSVGTSVSWAQDQNTGCFPGGSVKRPDAVSALVADPSPLSHAIPMAARDLHPKSGITSGPIFGRLMRS